MIRILSLIGEYNAQESHAVELALHGVCPTRCLQSLDINAFLPNYLSLQEELQIQHHFDPVFDLKPQ